MTKILRIENLFNFLLLAWCVSIPFKNAFYQISTFLLILFFLINIINKDRLNYFLQLCKKFKDILLVLLLIFISMTISNLINDVSNTKAWHLELMFFLRYVLIGIVLVYFYSRSYFTKKELTIFLFITFSIQAFDGLYQMFLGVDFFKDNIGNIHRGLTGATFNRNTFGFIMGLALIFLIIHYKKNEFIFFLMFIIFTFNIIFSYSRSAWVSTFTALILFSIIKRKNFNKNLIYPTTIFILFLILVFINVDPLYNRYLQLLDGYSTHRNEIWIVAIELINNSLLFGYGIDTWKTLGLNSFSSIHNSLLEILFSLGILGLLSFSLFLYLTIKEIFLNKKFILYVIIVYFFVVSQFDHSIITNKIFLSYLTISLFYIFSERINESKKSNCGFS